MGASDTTAKAALVKKQGRGILEARSRLASVVALLLFLGSAAPVIAESAPPSSEEARSAPPSSEEITTALRAAEAEHEKEEAALEEELATPQAGREREASRTAYAGLKPAEAQSLLFETFNGQLGELNEDPGRLLSDLKIKETLSDNAALIEEANGEVVRGVGDPDVAGAVEGEALRFGAELAKCGEVLGTPEWFSLEGHIVWAWGGLVWIEGTNILVGVLSAGGNGQTCFQPVAPDPEYPEIPTPFGDPRLGAISLSTQP